jgi:DNA-binding response OmpR family regulator
MRRLRQKLEERPDQPVFLATIAGFGYRLNDEANRPS